MSMDQIRKVESLLQEKKDKTGDVLLANWTDRDDELWDAFRAGHMFECWGKTLEDCEGTHPLTDAFILYKEHVEEFELNVNWW